MKQQHRMVPLISQEMLSAQQKQIYAMHRQGLSNKEIAVKLSLGQRTVATQLSRIRKKAANLPSIYRILQRRPGN